MIDIKRIVVISLLVALSGCAPSATKVFLNESGRSSDAVFFFKHLDQSVDRDGVVNRRVTRIEGFPYLAANRFLASVKSRVQTKEAFNTWIDRLAELSLESRYSEVMNLSADEIKRLHRETGMIDEPTREDLWESVKKYALLMREKDQVRKNYMSVLKEVIEVPDDYSMTLRILGVYPIAALPIAYVSDGFFDTLREWQKMSPGEHEILGELTTYQLRNSEGPSLEEVSRRYQALEQDKLGLPVLDEALRSDLVRAYAPLIVQDSVDHYDRIGSVFWQENRSLGINPDNPVIYFYFSNAYYNGNPVWQINYVFWYSGRLGDNAPWFEHGMIDGVTFRVSLDSNGKPFMQDLMNNCGCSHQFYPRKNNVAGIKKRSMMFDALVPAWMPEEYPENPMQIRINSGWHQVQHIGAGPGAGKSKSYDLIPYEELESLPFPGEERRSMFNDEGIAPGSERIEPYFMFSGGIREIGAMRQRGHHPIAMIGRSHFDDPFLFDLHFIWQ